MLINLFLHNPIKYKDIEKYQYGTLFCISIYSLYTIKYADDYKFLSDIMLWFLSCETFFIPYYRLDTIIHHLLGIGFIYYPRIYSIPLKQITPHFITFTSVETSSIFLSTSYFLKEKIKKHKENKIYQYSFAVSNILLLSTFLKFRIYDFISKIIFNKDFYNDMIIKNTNSHIYLYSTTASFFLLNSYWFGKMLAVAYKMIQ
tara:strand:+ start:45243 stop:45848 length:606 start_codon:yes stop_codon:yes gene_type:complete